MPTTAMNEWLAKVGVKGFSDNGGAAAAAAATAPPRSQDKPASGGGTTLNFEFNAFIPGTLGKALASYDHPKDLKNQAAFEAMLKGVAGTWLPEPGSFADNNTGPWMFETDNRSWGGGSHRVGSSGSLSTADIGALKSKGKLFSHSTSGSTLVRWKHSGHFTSSGETGALDGPTSKSAGVKGDETHEDLSRDESTVTVTASAGYPFKALAPDIDYALAFNFKRDPSGKTILSGTITTNVFPFYELLINGAVAWKFSSKGSGPGLINLNTSQTSKLGPLTF